MPRIGIAIGINKSSPSGGGAPPVDPAPSATGSAAYLDILDEFTRPITGGYTTTGDAAQWQRKAAIDVVRIDRGNILLQDVVTPWQGVAPTGLTVTPGAGKIDSASWTNPAIMDAVTGMQYKFDNGTPVDFATGTSLTNIAVSSGLHTLSVRTKSDDLFGAWVNSSSFVVAPGTIAFMFGVEAESDGTTAVTSAVDTTGASFIVIQSNRVTGAFSPTVTDSKGNTYTALTDTGGSGLKAQQYACYNPVVGTGHTFSLVNSSGASGLTVLVFGGATMELESETGAAATQPGSITPVGNGRLLTVAWGRNDTNVLTIDSGFNVGAAADYIPGASLTVAGAYQIQTTATARNPTTNTDTGTGGGCTMACFKPA